MRYLPATSAPREDQLMRMLMMDMLMLGICPLMGMLMMGIYPLMGMPLWPVAAPPANVTW